VGPAENQTEPKPPFWQKLAGNSSFWRKLIGWPCLFIGLMGIILPIIPGIPFLIVGLAALSTEYRWVRSLLVWTKRKTRRFWPRKIQIPRAPRKNSRSSTPPS
jgi:hypothetical protein